MKWVRALAASAVVAVVFVQHPPVASAQPAGGVDAALDRASQGSCDVAAGAVAEALRANAGGKDADRARWLDRGAGLLVRCGDAALGDAADIDAFLDWALPTAEALPPLSRATLDALAKVVDARVDGLRKLGADDATSAADQAKDFDRADALGGRMLAVAERTLGKDAPELVPFLLEALPGPKDGRAALTARLLSACERAFGPESERVEQALDMRARWLESVGEPRLSPDIEATYARLEPLAEKLEGAESREAIDVLVRWARFRRTSGGDGVVALYARALDKAEKTADSTEDALDEIEQYCAPTSFEPWMSEEDRGPRASPADAEPLLRRVLALRERRADDPAIVGTLDALGAALVSLGKDAEGDAMDDRATAIVAQRNDPEALAERLEGDAVAAIMRGRAARGDALIARFEGIAATLQKPSADLPDDVVRRASDQLLMVRGEVVRGARLVRAAVALADRAGMKPDARVAFDKRVAEFYRAAGDDAATEKAYETWDKELGASADADAARLDFLQTWGSMSLLVGDAANGEAVLSRALPLAHGRAAEEANILGALVLGSMDRAPERVQPEVDRLLALSDEASEAAEACLGVAGLLAIHGDADRARAIFEHVTRARPTRHAWEAYGGFLESRGEWTGAIAALEKARAAAADVGPTPPPPPPPPDSDDDAGMPPMPDTPPPPPGGSGSDDASRIDVALARVLARAGRVPEARAKLASVLPDGAMPEDDQPDFISALVAIGDDARAAAIADAVLRAAAKETGEWQGSVLGPAAVAGGAIAQAYVLGGKSRAGLPWIDRAQDDIDHALARIALTGNERQNTMVGHLASLLAGAVSFQVAAAPDDPAAARLALRTVLRSKGRALEAASAGASALRARLAPEDRALFDSLAAKRQEIARRSEDGKQEGVEELKAEADRIELALATKSAPYRAATELATVENVQRRLPPRSALVEIARVSVPRPWTSGASAAGGAQLPVMGVGAPRYVAYVLAPTGDVRWVDLGPAGAIDAAVAAMRAALSDPDRPAEPAARAVDEKVMHPIRALLGDARHVLISPDGALDFVPFGAMLDETGTYLASRYAFTYLTSGRDLLRAPSPPPRSGAVVLANPAYGTYRAARSDTLLGHADFLPLAATEAEGEDVARALHAELITGDRANVRALLGVHGPSVLHVATHGFFFPMNGAADATGHTRGFVLDARGHEKTLGVPDNPLLRAGLALAGANVREDGVLTALEASSLDLYGTKLVVLSACETGLGDVTDGEGVLGMRRALELAGAESLVMTLWKVDDEATRALMNRYYAELARGAGRTQALVRAQAAMRAEHPHPYYWAAFVPIGDWRTLSGAEAVTTPEPTPNALRVKPSARGCACDVARAPSGVAPPIAALGAIAALLARRRTARRRRHGA